jgi:uncharacterized surface anchored protein
MTILRVLSVLVSLCAVPLLAQVDSGRLVGLVTDSSGAVIPNAKITVTNKRTGVEREATSDSAGTFTVTNLAPSSYDITASAPALGPTSRFG